MVSQLKISEGEGKAEARLLKTPQGQAAPKATGGAGFSFDFAGSVIIGSWPNDVIFKITGLGGFGLSSSPSAVFCQPRQSDNLDLGFSDQFAVQVIETGEDFLRVRIRRVDSNGSGWGQQLRLDFGIIN